MDETQGPAGTSPRIVLAISAWIAFIASGITTAGFLIRGCARVVAVVILSSVRAIGYIRGIKPLYFYDRRHGRNVTNARQRVAGAAL